MILLQVLGGLLLVLLLIDVLLTVLPPMGHGGPVHRRLIWLLWGFVRRSTRGFGASRRAGARAFAGPILAASAIAVWVVWLIAGFAILYITIPGAWEGSPDGTFAPFGEAFYYSGYVATTLGLGDLAPGTPLMRVLTVSEAVAGFALFAVSMTYLLAVAQSLGRLEELAFELAAARDLFTPTRRHVQGSADGARLNRWARGLLGAAVAHRQYPLIQFFRPTDPDRDLVAQVEWMLPSITEPRQVAGSDGAEDAPSLGLLREAIFRYLAELNRSCIPESFQPLEGPIRRADAAELHARLSSYLGSSNETPRTGNAPDHTATRQ